MERVPCIYGDQFKEFSATQALVNKITKRYKPPKRSETVLNFVKKNITDKLGSTLKDVPLVMKPSLTIKKVGEEPEFYLSWYQSEEPTEEVSRAARHHLTAIILVGLCQLHNPEDPDWVAYNKAVESCAREKRIKPRLRFVKLMGFLEPGSLLCLPEDVPLLREQEQARLEGRFNKMQMVS